MEKKKPKKPAAKKPIAMQDSTLDARHAAALCLEQVMIQKRQSDVFFSNHAVFLALSPQDKAFCQRITRATLRHMGELDAVFLPYFERPLGKNKYGVLAHIYLAATEIAFEKIPSYAAINSAVELVKSHYTGYEKLANAMLRRWLREHGGVIPSNPAANLPGWLLEKWRINYGDALEAIAECLTGEPALDISFKSTAARGRFLEALGGAATRVGESVRTNKKQAVTELPEYAEGHWWVQDVAATLPVYLLGDIKGKTVLDMCAAPGGKTMQMAAAGAKVVALDSAQARLDVVAENIARLGMEVEKHAVDALEWQAEEGYQAILLDAPCSATGTLRRNPDVKYIRSKKNLLKATELQKQLLDKAISLMAPGGKLVYCVCSMEKEEGEDVVQAALDAHPNITLANDAAYLPLDVLASGKLGFRTHPGLLPEQGGMDGFFMSCLEKK